MYADSFLVRQLAMATIQEQPREAQHACLRTRLQRQRHVVRGVIWHLRSLLVTRGR